MKAETPYLNQAFDAQTQRQIKIAEKKQSVSQLRVRLGTLIRTHINFPEEINGKKIKRIHEGFHTDTDRVSIENSLIKRKKNLTRPVLDCAIESEKRKLAVHIGSNVYPFENTKEEAGESDHVEFTIAIPQLDGGYKYYLQSDGIRYGFKDKFHHDVKSASPEQVKILEEVLGLIEDPAITSYAPHSQSFAKRA